MMATTTKYWATDLGEIKIVEDPDDDEGSLLVESVLTGKRFWIDGWRIHSSDDETKEQS